jgi:hypothetical protein
VAFVRRLLESVNGIVALLTQERNRGSELQNTPALNGRNLPGSARHALIYRG